MHIENYTKSCQIVYMVLVMLCDNDFSTLSIITIIFIMIDSKSKLLDA